MQCVAPVRLTKNLNRLEYPDGLLVPCGKCIGCRIAKRKEWVLRMVHELDSHEEACFITLTYDNDNVPVNKETEFYTLRKKDLQKYFKRLRKRIYPRKIRYYACGEYGDQTLRPHYHAIIFGLGLSKSDQDQIIASWQYGLVHIGLAEPDSIRYVAQYIDKKFTGDLADEEYGHKGREPVFRLQSLGIGRDFCDKNSEQLIHNKCTTMKGILHKLPRYYINRLGIPLEELKNKAYEKESDLVAKHTGFNYSRDEAYRILEPEKVIKLERAIKESKNQSELNMYAKVNLKKKKL